MKHTLSRSLQALDRNHISYHWKVSLCFVLNSSMSSSSGLNNNHNRSMIKHRARWRCQLGLQNKLIDQFCYPRIINKSIIFLINQYVVCNMCSALILWERWYSCWCFLGSGNSTESFNTAAVTKGPSGPSAGQPGRGDGRSWSLSSSHHSAVLSSCPTSLPGGADGSAHFSFLLVSSSSRADGLSHPAANQNQTIP